MGKTCCVCGITERKSAHVSFHSFPAQEELRMQWIAACKLANNQDTNTKYVCSKHFNVKDFDESYWPKRRLIRGAIPAPSNIYFATSTMTSKSTCIGTSNAESSLEISGNPGEESSDVIADTTSQPSSVHMDIDKGDFILDILEQPAKQTADASVAAGSSIESRIAPDLHKTDIKQTISDARYIGDLQIEHFSSPRKAKRHLGFIKHKVDEQRKKMRLLQQKNSRLQKRINTLTSLLDHLKEEDLISNSAHATIMEKSPGTIQKLLERQLISKNRKYDEEIKSFALTLHFYSAKAYAYVRRQFNNLLPHPGSLRRWYQVVDGEPGFTKEAFKAISLQCVNKKVIVNLTLDEMSIRQKIEWDGKKFHGFVDVGTELDGDGDFKEEAKSALVFLAVAVNGNWKVPLGYFLITSLTGKERAGILTTCLELLYETGAECRSITFDGAPVNLNMCTALGTSFCIDKLEPWFLHPNTKEKVYTFLDPSHSIKLCRNALGDLKTLIAPNNEEIKWQHLVSLNNLQYKEGLVAANKITKRHINFHNEKMRVKLAAQTLSNSASRALLFCKSLKLDEFQDSEATSEFCRIINNSFDILNSRNHFSKKIFSKPISNNNYNYFKNEIEKYTNYVLKLKLNSGELVINSNRKTGFLGFVIGLKNYLSLYEELVAKDRSLKYILSYKLSQDHLETFFSAVRSRGGFNNNPSALHFKSAYKKLLVRHQVSSSMYGNCGILDATSILNVDSGIHGRTKDTIFDEVDVELTKFLIQADHSYCSSVILSPFVENVVEYIAGFIIKKIKIKLNCNMCISTLESETKNVGSLTNIIDRGKLIYPSTDVLKICKKCEMVFRRSGDKIFNRKNIKEYLCLLVLRDSEDIFCSEYMNNHILNQNYLDNHKVQLIKLICSTYFEIRLHHEAKMKKNKDKSIRQKYTKLILFQNQ